MSVAATVAVEKKNTRCRLQPAGREMPSSGDVDCARETTKTGSSSNSSSNRRLHSRTADVAASGDLLSPYDIIAKHRVKAQQHRKSSKTSTTTTDARKASQTQQQPEVVTLGGVGGGGGSCAAASDDDDDRASVCSSQSSASEHSTTSRSSAGSKSHRRTRCPLHHASRSSGRRQQQPQDATTNSGDSTAAFKPGEASGTCTCRSSTSGRRKQTSTVPAAAGDDAAELCNVERPEPEGGLLTGPLYKSTIDEFERLIYGPSEPLFSDCEDSVDDETSKIVVEATPTTETRLTRAPRVIGSWTRTAAAGGDTAAQLDPTESLFSAAQMVNSNNLMKFAIIQTELKNVKDVSLRRAENDVTAMWRRIEALHDGCGQTDTGFHSAAETLAQLLAALKASRALEDQRKTSSHQLHAPADSGRQGSLSSSCSHVTVSAVRRQLHVTAVDVYKAEASLDAAEKQVGQLEEELKAAVSAMSVGTAGQSTIRDITLRLKEAEHRAAFAEKSVFQLRREAARHDDETKASRKKHQPISERLSGCTFTELTGC